jgi:hypothetical protein
MSWHDIQCSSLHLVWDDGRPGCLRCERWAPELTPAHPIPPPPPPSHTPRSKLQCSWPPLVTYEQTPELDEMESSLRKKIDTWEIGELIPSEDHWKPPDRTTMEINSWYSIYLELPDDDSTRFLRLHPSDTLDGPVHCSLETVRLNDPSARHFEAISYTWADSNGDTSLCEKIYIGPEYHVLPVTKSCLAALRQFRTSTDRLLWIDAVCINQADVRERGHQVSLMHSIYTSASCVLVYLGDCGKEIEYAMALLKSPNISFSVEIYNGLVRLPYFSRVWVVQEVKLAREATISCGTTTIHWKTLQAQTRTPSNLITPFAKAWIYSNKDDILPLLLDTVESCCFDPRDKIFALMGLVRQGVREELPIDYSLSVQQLYTGLAHYWLQTSNIDVLDMALKPKRIPNLPSWVPDWTAQIGLSNKNSGPSIVSYVVAGLSPSPDHLSSPNSDRHFKWRLVPTEESDYHSRDSSRRNAGIHRIFNGFAIATTAVPLFWVLTEEEEIQTVYDIDLQVSVRTPRKFLNITADPEQGRKEQDAQHKSMYVVYLPLMNRAFIMKKHDEIVYSLRAPVELQYYDVGRSIAELFGTEPLQGFEEHLQRLERAEAAILESWIMTVIYLGMGRMPVLSNTLLDVPGCLQWVWRFPQTVNTCRDHFSVSDASQATSYADFLLMQDLRSQLWEWVRQEEFSDHPSNAHFRSLGEVSPNRERALFSMRHIANAHDHILANDVSNKKWSWQQYNLSRKQQKAKWRDMKLDLRSRKAKLGPLSTAVNDVHDSRVDPSFCFSKEHHLPAVANECPYDLFEPLLDHEELNQPKIRLSLQSTILRAIEFVEQLDLDKTMPWQWNRDPISIHVATLDMIVQLQESLRDRRALKRFEKMAPSAQRIIIV